MAVTPVATCTGVLVTNAAGGSVTVDLADTPPLQPNETYVVRICNLGSTAITLNLHATIGYSLSTVIPSGSTSSSGTIELEASLARPAFRSLTL